LIPEERIRLAVEVHHQEIEVAIVVHIDRVDTHARFRGSVLVEGAPHRQGRLAEAAAALVQPEVIGRTVVGHEDIDAAVSVEVAGDDTEAVANRGLHSGTHGYVGKRAVAIVVV
jgi:hypothetical protein